MKLTFGSNISFLSFYGAIKTASPNYFSINPDGCKPFFMGFTPMDTHKPRFIIFSRLSGIAAIYSCRDIPKVIDPVIGSDPVNMVNVIKREITIHVKPCKPMHLVEFIVDTARKIATFAYRANSIANLPIISRATDKAGKNPSVRIVMEQLFQSFLCKHFGHLLSVGFNGVWRCGDKSHFWAINPSQTTQLYHLSEHIL
jgi:hypothetical protein